MITELKAGAVDVFNVLRDTEGEEVAFVTHAGTVSSFDSSKWSVVWSGEELDTWITECLNAGIEPEEVGEIRLGGIGPTVPTELTLQATDLQSQINGLASQLAALMAKVG